MKYLAHIPTEQFGFISVEVEGTVDEVVLAYREVAEAVKRPVGSELTRNEWIELYDLVASGKTVNGDPGVVEKLNPLQRFALNEAKNRIKRLK